MEKSAGKIILVIVIIAVLLAAIVCGVAYMLNADKLQPHDHEGSPAEVARQTSDDGAYEVIMQQVGQAAGGDAFVACITLMKNGEHVVQYDVQVKEKDALSKDNWKVEWHADHVDVTITGDGQKPTYLKFALD
jgi:flagellar basal body-associated protein FliL